MNHPVHSLRCALVAAALLAATSGCHALPTARRPLPPMPKPASGPALGERGILLDQMQQMAAEDAGKLAR